MLTIERDGLSQAIRESRALPPSGGRLKFRRVCVEAADVDRFLVGRPFDVLDPAGAGDLEEERRQLAKADRPIAADVERLAVAGLARSGSEEGIRRVVDIDEIAHLRAVPVNLDRAVL